MVTGMIMMNLLVATIIFSTAFIGLAPQPLAAYDIIDGKPVGVNEVMLDEALQSTANMLRAPKSAQFRNLIAGTLPNGETVVCGRVSGHNGFGGYGDSKPFVVRPASGEKYLLLHDGSFEDIMYRDRVLGLMKLGGCLEDDTPRNLNKFYRTKSWVPYDRATRVIAGTLKFAGDVMTFGETVDVRMGTKIGEIEGLWGHLEDIGSAELYRLDLGHDEYTQSGNWLCNEMPKYLAVRSPNENELYLHFFVEMPDGLGGIGCADFRFSSDENAAPAAKVF